VKIAKKKDHYKKLQILIKRLNKIYLIIQSQVQLEWFIVMGNESAKNMVN